MIHVRNPRRIRFRFTLGTMFWILLVVALLLAWWVDHRSLTHELGQAQLRQAKYLPEAARREVLWICCTLIRNGKRNGAYPSTEEGSYPSTEEGLKPILRKIPIDPWGNEYRYRHDRSLPSLFTVRSIGPDGQAETKDDIVMQSLFDEPDIVMQSQYDEPYDVFGMCPRCGGDRTTRPAFRDH